MKYAIVEGVKSEPFKGAVGLCEVCGNEVIAKCGVIKIHHWAHKSLIECDSWWENETIWHRNWKNLFPIEWQEVTHKDVITGEIHRADIKTDFNLIIELQNSPISIDEQVSRETFYENMIWIINGEKFKKNFYILDKLPNPSDEFVRDIVFDSRRRADLGKTFFRHSLNPDLRSPKYPFQMFRVSNMEEIQNEIEESYIGHHLYDWVKPRKNWLTSKSKVFIDFWDEYLYNLTKYDYYKLSVVRMYKKEYIIERILNSKFRQKHLENS